MIVNRKRIGLYLDSGPSCGGSYQYNRYVLQALVEFANESNQKIELIPFVKAEHWEDILKNLQQPYVKIASGGWLNHLWQRVPGLWRRLSLPLATWHWLASKIDPLYKVMASKHCDVYIFPAQDAHTYLMPLPTIGVIHDLMHRYERSFPEVGTENEFAKREYHYSHMCKASKAILVDSELGKRMVEESYMNARPNCQVLPYISPYTQQDIVPAEFYEKYKLPSKYLFYPAQFWQHKNHSRLLKAIAEVKKKIPNVQLVLVGSPKNGYQDMLNLIESLDLSENVKIFGLVDDCYMPGFYKHARALIMPTFFGPSNIPPLEAFSLGCPVAVSKIYAMPDLYQDAALYFDPNSVEELVSVIQRLWEEDILCQKLIKEGTKRHQDWHFPQFKLKLLSIVTSIIH